MNKLKELDVDKIIVSFKCGNCGETSAEDIQTAIYSGPPICLNECCSDFQDEMDLDKIEIEE
jgi:hypothetical protein